MSSEQIKIEFIVSPGDDFLRIRDPEQGYEDEFGSWNTCEILLTRADLEQLTNLMIAMDSK